MDPGQIDRFLNLIIHKKYDFVSGSRFLVGSSRKNNPLIRLILIRSFSIFLNLIFKKNVSDTTCGFRAFKIKIFKNFKKNFFRKELFTYGYEYFSYGKILQSKNIKFIETAVSMNYPPCTCCKCRADMARISVIDIASPSTTFAASSHVLNLKMSRCSGCASKAAASSAVMAPP